MSPSSASRTPCSRSPWDTASGPRQLVSTSLDRARTYLLRTHEHEMLAEVCETLQVLWIAQMTNFDIHTGGGLVGLGIRDEEHLHSVFEDDEPVHPRRVSWALGAGEAGA